MKRTPKQMALDFRVRQYCDAIGWDTTMKDCADALDVHCNAVRQASVRNGWQNNFRSTKHDAPFGAERWSGPQIGKHHRLTSFNVEVVA